MFSFNFVPFLSLRERLSRETNLQVIDFQGGLSLSNLEFLITTSFHQNGPCDPVKVASQRNSLVWKITSSISSSRILMPKSERILLSAICYSCVTMGVPSPPVAPPLLFVFLAVLSPASLHLLCAAVANSPLLSVRTAVADRSSEVLF